MPNSRQDKPLTARLKEFFRVGKHSGFHHPSSHELQLKPEIVEELASDQPIQELFQNDKVTFDRLIAERVGLIVNPMGYSGN